MIEDVFREKWPRIVASLARRSGDLDVAEEAAGEAFLAATTVWRREPSLNPDGWLMTTATRNAIGRLYRELQPEAKQAEDLLRQAEPEPAQGVSERSVQIGVDTKRLFSVGRVVSEP